MGFLSLNEAIIPPSTARKPPTACKGVMVSCNISTANIVENSGTVCIIVAISQALSRRNPAC